MVVYIYIYGKIFTYKISTGIVYFIVINECNNIYSVTTALYFIINVLKTLINTMLKYSI